MKKFNLNTSGMEILNTILTMKEYCNIDFSFDFDSFLWFVGELGENKIYEICSPSKKKVIEQAMEYLTSGINPTDKKLFYHLMKPVNIHLYSWYIHNYPKNNVPIFIRNKYPSKAEILYALDNRMKRAVQNNIKELGNYPSPEKIKEILKIARSISSKTADELFELYEKRELTLEIFSYGIGSTNYHTLTYNIRVLADKIRYGEKDGLSVDDILKEKHKFYKKIHHYALRLPKILDDQSKFMKPSEALEIIGYQIKKIGDLCYVLGYEKPKMDESVFQPMADIFNLSLDELMVKLQNSLEKRRQKYRKDIVKEQNKLEEDATKILV